jgi:hypothetical protein
VFSFWLFDTYNILLGNGSTSSVLSIISNGGLAIYSTSTFNSLANYSYLTFVLCVI